MIFLLCRYNIQQTSLRMNDVDQQTLLGMDDADLHKYYVAKLKEEFNYDYTGGNPMVQYQIFGTDKEYWFIQSVKRGELSLVKYLVEQGANIDYDALPTAYYRGYHEIVNYLIKQGADTKALDLDYNLLLIKTEE